MAVNNSPPSVVNDRPLQFPGTRQVTLEQNYRSTTPILEASNAVMRFSKTSTVGFMIRE